MQSLSSFLVPGARVAIVGSRDFPCPSLVEAFVIDLPGCVVVSGSNITAFEKGASLNSCGGIVDITAVISARDSGLSFVEFSPDWRRYGRGAGKLRNSIIVASGLDVMVAFASNPVKLSPGTADVVKKAKAAGVPVFVFGADGSMRGARMVQLALVFGNTIL